MSISGIGSYAASMLTPSRGSAGTSASAAATAADNTPATKSGSGGVQKTDFTQMTHKQLFDWVNSKIASGEMSFDESSTFISMTVSMPVDGSSMAPDDKQPVNFMQSVRDGMERALQTNDSDLFARLQTALHTMQRSQGEVRGVNMTV
ncbi:hypothetical protein I8G32_02331 [Rhodopseudomonas palustris]|uniref:Uncharacterized protein n=2 Tax=Rhodopseudomonas palustris TaxID=1076 RepID=Q6N7J0_RHOPA|nr:hypothetical protein [Rhodopseudomonas palustris]OPF90460.1 hypothetical protein B1S06_24140 [Rhodopseudomonas palustris]PPQ42941.1 hypothetical protein CKO39_13560 [Rhodopseudomonas palustris]QQM03788.1 hypothetical protein I8G32_02331 [Rhodopseudomonas palustris]RJF61857.1 hypothetical protein D4Q71_19090 [Rhodopseudomonas palustris]WCL92429.1 hypothetical protein TX73_011730 [Rhodopseudomonas palustris CGA009]